MTPEPRTDEAATPDTSDAVGVNVARPPSTAARAAGRRARATHSNAAPDTAPTAVGEPSAAAPAAAADTSTAAADTSSTAAAAAPSTAAPTTLAALKPDPHNRRKHPARNQALIADALQHVGAARSIVIDEDDVILAGNGVVDAARTKGLTKLQVVDADGDTIIAVRRSNLSVAQKRELALYDNRTGELAEWNADQLDIDFKAGLNFAPFFTDQELAKLLPDNDAAQPTSVANPEPQYIIIVTCTDEVQQTDVLEQLLRDGLECRAVVS